jgi:hypothetical protein
MSVEIQNLKQNLKILNGFDPALRKEMGKRFRALAKPAVDQANSTRKSANWPRGFDHGGRTGYRADKAVTARMNTRKARNRNIAAGAKYETLAVLSVTTKGAASAIADMAGKTGDIQMSGRSRAYPGRPTGHALNGQGAGLIKGLNKHMGHPSRMMWPSVEATMTDYERAVRALVADVEEAVNRELMKIGSNAHEVRRMMR